MARRFLVPISLYVSPLDPATATDGQVYFNSDSNELKIYYNGQWNTIQGSGGGGGSSDTSGGLALSDAWWLGA